MTAELRGRSKTLVITFHSLEKSVVVEKDAVVVVLGENVGIGRAFAATDVRRVRSK